MSALIEIFANNAYTTLAAAVNASQTTITVSDATSFPIPGTNQFFRMSLTSAGSPNTDVEIVFVTGVSGTTFTVDRGQEGTTAQSWSFDDLCGNESTAGTYNSFLRNYYAPDTGSANSYAVAIPNSATSYYSGMPVAFLTFNANISATPTLNVNGIGAATITNVDGSSLLPGQIPSGCIVQVEYNALSARWELQSLDGIAVTPPSGDSSTKIATTAFVQSAITSYFPPGTTLPFYQAAAPTGWTKITTINDAALRIVNTTGGTVGGSVPFTTAFSSQAVTGSVGNTTLDVSQMPYHSHGVNDPSHQHAVNSSPGVGQGASGPNTVQQSGSSMVTYPALTGISIQSNGGNQPHNHSFTGNSINLSVSYCNFILCTKN